MEAAQCSVKRSKILNESGNFIVVFSIMLMIIGGVGYYMSLSDKVDSEIRSLGAIQKTVYMKTDLRETIGLTIAGSNPECTPAINSELKSKFTNFNTSMDDAKFTYLKAKSNIKNDPLAKCFFHPTRYTGVGITSLSVQIIRATEPNFISLSSFVTANVRVETNTNGKQGQLKYSFRYRVDVLSLNHFGLISDGSGKLFEVEDDGFVQVNSWVLVDQANRTNRMQLGRFIDDEFRRVKYNRDFSIAAPGLLTDNATRKFLLNHHLRNLFSFGIKFNSLPTSSSFRAPYQQLTSTQWRDLFNYDVMNKLYPLPKLTSGPLTAISSPALGIISTYDKNKDNVSYNPDTINKNTATIYQSLHGDKKFLTKSCDYSDLGTGQFNLFIFNNFQEDFTIDFSGNTTSDNPPFFCGLIAARNLTIILNDQTTDDLRENHFLGKIIVKGTIRVINKGVLHLNDIMDVSNDTIPYTLPDLANIKLQYYNQKYYSAQNFNLPFFTNQSIYSSSNPEDRFYIPKDTKEYFTKACGSYRCRMDEIDVPSEKKIIDRHVNNLLYEVFRVE